MTEDETGCSFVIVVFLLSAALGLGFWLGTDTVIRNHNRWDCERAGGRILLVDGKESCFKVEPVR